MLQILLSLVFWLINFIANLVLSPILGLMDVLIGNNISSTAQASVASIFTFFDIVSSYILIAIDLLCIPRELFLFLFFIVLGILSYVIFARIYVFTLAIYEHFKP